MKKIITSILVLLICVSLLGCGASTDRIMSDINGTTWKVHHRTRSDWDAKDYEFYFTFNSDNTADVVCTEDGEFDEEWKAVPYTLEKGVIRMELESINEHVEIDCEYKDGKLGLVYHDGSYQYNLWQE